jgi:hypothetical protein
MPCLLHKRGKFRLKVKDLIENGVDYQIMVSVVLQTSSYWLQISIGLCLVASGDLHRINKRSTLKRKR